MGFNSKQYKNYKPYQSPAKGYHWKDYVTLSADGQSITNCHTCDIRMTGCQSPLHPRYYCKKNKKEKQYWKSKAMTLLMQVRRLTPRMTDKEVIEFNKELEENE